MKRNKTLLLVGMLITASGTFAQNNNGSATILSNPAITPAAAPTNTSLPAPMIMSKKGEMYLPQAGDWAISMDATPWISYLGNLIHGPSNSATTSFLSSNQRYWSTHCWHSNYRM